MVWMERLDATDMEKCQVKTACLSLNSALVAKRCLWMYIMLGCLVSFGSNAMAFPKPAQGGTNNLSNVTVGDIGQ